MSEIAIIGGGPAGLMAAEVLAKAGQSVAVYERKPSLGRKFLMAGRGGLNLTHSEHLSLFTGRYRSRSTDLAPLVHDFNPDALRQWCEGLGQETFVGSSGRVFPKSMKASPLLRAWLARLGELGVSFHLQHTWKGWRNGALVFETAQGAEKTVMARATLLALGGASWPSLGSDGAWVDYMSIPVAPLRPANCGFSVEWSDFMKQKAGQPLKNISVTHAGTSVAGEMMVAEKGVEGGAIYALSAPIRDDILANGTAQIKIDLRPGLSHGDIVQKLSLPRARQSLATYLQKTLGLTSLQNTLLREVRADVGAITADDLASLIKAVPLTLTTPFPIERAISTAGGIPFEELDANLMLRQKPGVFCAGEMLDWEAPTGGYLLQATFATARAAASGILRWLEK